MRWGSTTVLFSNLHVIEVGIAEYSVHNYCTLWITIIIIIVRSHIHFCDSFFDRPNGIERQFRLKCKK